MINIDIKVVALLPGNSFLLSNVIGQQKVQKMLGPYLGFNVLMLA